MGMDPEAFITLWDLTIDKMVRFHDNISTEVQQLIITIQKTRDGEGNKMVPMAEEKAAFGKKIKADIRAMWSMEYEIEQLQGILGAIRGRQRVKLAEIKKEYDAAIEPLEPLYIKRPPKPAPKPKEEAKPAPAEPEPAAKEAPAPAAVTA